MQHSLQPAPPFFPLNNIRSWRGEKGRRKKQKVFYTRKSAQAAEAATPGLCVPVERCRSRTCLVLDYSNGGYTNPYRTPTNFGSSEATSKLLGMCPNFGFYFRACNQVRRSPLLRWKPKARSNPTHRRRPGASAESKAARPLFQPSVRPQDCSGRMSSGT